MKTLYSLLLLFSVCTLRARAQCTLTMTHDFGTNSPLLISNGQFVYPARSIGVSLSFTRNQMQEGYCPGAEVEELGVSTQADTVSLTCHRDTRFRTPNNLLQFSNIRCSRDPVSSTRETGNCLVGRLIEIGFQVATNFFMPTIDLCYDSKMSRTYWAHSVVPGAIRGRQTIGAAPAFKVGTDGYFDDVPIVRAYTRESQRQIVLNIYGQNANLRNRYISATGEHYFAKGHLVPRADMFYTAQQYSTFYYLNAQPMYQSVNNGNWRLVEDTVRTIAKNVGDLEVWTGNLYDLNLSNQPIYLARNTQSNAPALVVPKLFFKLAYSPSTSQAIVFITVNNPFLGSSQLPSYAVCPEYATCRRNHPQFSKFDRGFTYCCLYRNFIQDQYASSIGLPALPNNLTPLL